MVEKLEQSTELKACDCDGWWLPTALLCKAKGGRMVYRFPSREGGHGERSAGNGVRTDSKPEQRQNIILGCECLGSPMSYVFPLLGNVNGEKMLL